MNETGGLWLRGKPSSNLCQPLGNLTGCFRLAQDKKAGQTQMGSVPLFFNSEGSAEEVKRLFTDGVWRLAFYASSFFRFRRL